MISIQLFNCTIRWCKVERADYMHSIVVIVLNGIGREDYLAHTECFERLDNLFSDVKHC